MSASAYYNEDDPFAAAWLRALITKGLIADGTVDERSISEVSPSDLTGFTQCHFFAGIGGWSAALRLAGWPDDRPVWTGSCPCQPFSAAGRGAAFADARHLWPVWFNLIKVCRPPVVFGEQVDKALAWLDLVQTDMEGEDYAFGAVDLPAGSVGAFHRRQRIYFVADTAGERRAGQHPLLRPEEGRWDGAGEIFEVAGRGAVELLALAKGQQVNGGRDTRRGRGEPADPRQLGNAHHPRPQGRRLSGSAGERDRADQWPAGATGLDGPASRDMEHPSGDGRIERRAESGEWGAGGGCGEGGMVLPASEQVGVSGRTREPRSAVADADGRLSRDSGVQRSGRHLQQPEDAPAGFWDGAEWIYCRDNKWRPVEPGTFPLAHGVPARVGRLRGYGNAIVPPLAQAFIEAYLEGGGVVGA